MSQKKLHIPGLIFIALALTSTNSVGGDINTDVESFRKAIKGPTPEEERQALSHKPWFDLYNSIDKKSYDLNCPLFRKIPGIIASQIQLPNGRTATPATMPKKADDFVLNKLKEIKRDNPHCFIATPQEPARKVTTSKTEDLPFIGRRTFNFYGGSGTTQVITITNGGSTTIETVGRESSTIEFSGPYKNPIAIPNTDTAYYIENNEIFYTTGGEAATGCKDEETTCSSGLYEIN